MFDNFECSETGCCRIQCRIAKARKGLLAIRIKCALDYCILHAPLITGLQSCNSQENVATVW